MKLAVLSDIHANWPALRAVLADIKLQRILEIWNLGDIVGYAPFPNETVAMLKKGRIKSISGNYDEKVLDFFKNREEWRGKKTPAKYFSFAWTNRVLLDEARVYLKELPDTLTLHWSGKKFLLVHASLQNPEEGLTEATPMSRFSELAKRVKTDVVLCGHSHRYFMKEAGGVLFVNPGSVGRPFDGDPRASYAVIEVKTGRLHVQNRRIAYPIEETVGRMREQSFPLELIESIASGKSVDDMNTVSPALDDAQAIQKILSLAEACHYEKEHARQVTALALQLFDQMQELHGLGPQERLWLQAAGFLHDIGWVEGQKRHHKAGRDIILSVDDFPLPREAQIVIALLARYHRQGIPQERHKYFCDLTPEMKTVVRKLAAMLRVADGLDRSHRSLVQEISCQVQPDKVLVRFRSSEDCGEECRAAKEKADLFHDVFKRSIAFERSVYEMINSK